ncbi:hypothetical protein GCM10008940_03980 [Microbulbifer agarilyticus]
MLVRDFAVLTLAILIIGVVTGVAAWVTRHTWLPWLINQQFDNARVTSIEQLQVSRGDGDWRAHIQRLVIQTDHGQQVSLDNLQIRQLDELFAHVLAASRDSAPKAEISIDQVTVEKAGHTSAQSAPGESGQDHEPKATTRRESDADRSQATGAEQTGGTEREALKISHLLQQLQSFPVRSVEIRTLQIPDYLPGYSTAQFSFGSQGAIEGDIRNSRCDGCLLSLDIEPDKDHPQFQFELTRNQDVIASVTGNLQKIPQNAPATWGISTNTKLSAEPLSVLIADLVKPLPQSSTENWQNWLVLLADSRGSATVNLSGKIEDDIRGLQGISSLRNEIQLNNLTVPLPKILVGTPLLITTNTKSPIKLALDSLNPLSAREVGGELTIEVQSQPQGNGVSLLNAEIQLTESTDGRPQVAVDGNLDLTNWQEVLEHPGIKNYLSGYEIEDLSGTQEFSVSFALPKLDTKIIEAKQYIRDFSAQWKFSDNTEFLLKMPKSKTPVTLKEWRKTQITVSGDQSISFSAVQIPGSLQASTPLFTVLLETPDQPKGDANAKITTRLLELSCADAMAKACVFQFDIHASNLSLPEENTRLDNFTLETKIKVRDSTDPASFAIDLSDLNLTVDKSISGEISAENSELFSSEASCEINTARMHCESPQIAVSFATLALAGHSLEGIVFLEDFQLTRSEDKAPQNAEESGWVTTGLSNYRADQLTVKTANALTIQLASHGKVDFNNKQLSGVSTVTSGPLQIDSKWQHNRENQKGTLELVLPPTEFSRSNSLALGIDGLPANLVDGKLEGSAKLHWPNSQQDTAQAFLSDAVVQYNNSYAVGIDSTISLEREGESWATTAPARVSADTIDAGVALKNLHFDLTINASGDVVLTDFSSELLEGALTSDTVKWNIGGEKRQSTFQFTGISLRALTNELESTNFSASGLMDARIPITTDAEGVTVADGSLQSRPPGGRMRYYGAFSPQMLSSNPQLKLVAGALEDYTYRDIHGTIQYPLSGDLQLNLKLTGNSQAIDTKRDLIINLNLENNIPSMLRSLQASRDLTDVLEKEAQ